MDVIVIFNGLGNQMSQYAFYLQKKEIDKRTYHIAYSSQHNGLELNNVFGIKLNENFWHKMLYLVCRMLLIKKFKILSRPIQWFLNLLQVKLIAEANDYRFNEEYLMRSTLKGITFYHGGWHDERYFRAVDSKIKSVFKFIPPVDEVNIALTNQIEACNSVSIHVRRGDYLEAINKQFANVCEKSYYERAIDLISSKISQPHYFVFSNDIEWVKANLKLNNVTYVSSNKGENSWKDMYLMSRCKHNIIANSSFSWWGAWLNKNDKKIVISPDRFINSHHPSDIFPDSWNKIPSYTSQSDG